MNRKDLSYEEFNDRDSLDSQNNELSGDKDSNSDPKQSIITWLSNPTCETQTKVGDAEIKAYDVAYQRVNIIGEENCTIPHEEKKRLSHSLLLAISLRHKYMTMSQQNFNKTTLRYLMWLEESKNADELLNKVKSFDIKLKTDEVIPIKKESEMMNEYLKPWPLTFTIEHGVIQMKIMEENVNDTSIISMKHLEHLIEAVPKLDRSEFITDFKYVRNLLADGPLKSYCYRRLSFISSKYEMHTLLNKDLESYEQKNVSHRDFYNIRKVDNHIHGSSCMNQKHLLRFIKKSVKTYPDKLVCVDKETKQTLTLDQLFRKLNLMPYDLSIDNLDVHADSNTFHRFDKFNLKYNPIGVGELREVFLKTKNNCEGLFFARILKEVIADIEDSKYQYTELRLSVYGNSIDEWDQLARWANRYNLYSRHNVWIIQVPRLYDVYRTNGMVKSFQEILNNLFLPLFEVTTNPASHPDLERFLKNVGALDSVDDESKPEKGPMYKIMPSPEEWTSYDNPPYDYYLYYMYANLVKLNYLRQEKMMNTLTLRPHCGEAGHIYHLISGFLLADNINHGLLLRKSPQLQYLYYLCQVPISMAPLSNNSLFLNYHRNPLPDFLAKGLKISISTDDPLQFHFTKEPLMEEYSIAAQVWKLTSTDMCELAKNSILMSGFTREEKISWLGEDFENDGVDGNVIDLSNVPSVRVAFRQETLVGELISLLLAVVGSGLSITVRQRAK